MIADKGVTEFGNKVVHVACNTRDLSFNSMVPDSAVYRLQALSVAASGVWTNESAFPTVSGADAGFEGKPLINFGGPSSRSRMLIGSELATAA
ncbi:MAG: hypothetical protein EOP06_04625 [Proteobacteria bacterium]|nr:MAG: hypothetical protein EOP06_04625 [Pseudomonadota bacterium]